MKNNKGFTLVDLLAVIVIMGILMIVVIPVITRTIENVRKDTFIDIVKQYVNGVKTMCGFQIIYNVGDYVSSAVQMCYYIEVDSAS